MNSSDLQLFNNVPTPISEMLLPEPEEEERPSTGLLEKEQHIATEIYDNYSFDHEYDNTLPITDERQRVVQTIESNRVTVIQGKNTEERDFNEVLFTLHSIFVKTYELQCVVDTIESK